MTATVNPRDALADCITALHPLAASIERAAAADMAQEALRGSPYPAASLETAACLWEAVLDMEREADDADATDESQRRGSLIRAARDAMGSSALRLSVLSWVDAVDAAWLAADTDNGAFPRGGQYDDAFDWAFVPNWIVENVDWDGPNAPTVRAPAPAAPRDPWDGCDSVTRPYLIAQGFEPEMAGGGCIRAHWQGPNGAVVLATDVDGSGMPDAHSWAIGVYAPTLADDDGGEAVQMFHSDPSALSLPQAVAAALAIAHLLPAASAPAVPAVDVLPATMSFYVAAVSNDHGIEWSDVIWWDGDATRQRLLSVCLADDATRNGAGLNDIVFYGPFDLGGRAF